MSPIITEESTFAEINAVVQSQAVRTPEPAPRAAADVIAQAAQDQKDLLGVLGPLGAVVTAGLAAYTLYQKKADQVRPVVCP